MLLVDAIRIEMPGLGTRKLCHILRGSLKDLGIGRDALFTILKANHRLITSKKKYQNEKYKTKNSRSLETSGI
ncbi:MAG: hypothetical protein ACPH2K_01305 [Flavicella sp.]